MSSRQRMAQTGSGRPIGGVLGQGGVGGLLSTLTGQDKIAGGPTQGPNGELQPGLFTGSSGLFGGASRSQAAQYNSLINAILAQQRGTSKLSSQESTQRMSESKLSNELAEHLMGSKQFLDMATSRGMTADEMKVTAGSIGKEVASNLIQQQQNIGSALQTPDVKAATKNQLIAEAGAQDAKNRNLTKLDTGMGGAAVMPGPNGGPPTSVTGAVPGGQSTSLVGTGPIDPTTGQPMMQTPVTTVQPYQQPRINMPIPQTVLNGANSITPGGANATPGLNTGMPPSDDQFLSTDSGVASRPGATIPSMFPQAGGGQKKQGGASSQADQNAMMNPARPKLNSGMPDPGQNQQYDPQQDPSWGGNSIIDYLKWVIANGGNVRMGGTNAYVPQQ